jgi:hypothetical protein
MLACLLLWIVSLPTEPAPPAKPVPSNPRIAVHVTPPIAPEPATVRIRTTVEPHTSNRQLQVTVDSGEFYRSSMQQLDGASAPRTTMFELRDLPSGDYQVTAQVTGPNGLRLVTRSRVVVVGMRSR